MTMAATVRTASTEHPWHEHELTFRELSESCRVECKLCGEGVRGRTYCCEACDVFLHERCALIEFPPSIQHPSHPQHPLERDVSTNQYSCSGCKFSVKETVAVATLPPPPPPHPEDSDPKEAEAEAGAEMILYHSLHQDHPLASFHVDILLSIDCSGCRRSISTGRVYGCRACIFLLHESCARSPDEMQHPLLHQHPLRLEYYVADDNLVYLCRICGSLIYGGLAYSCEECHDFRLHASCAASILLPEEGEKLVQDSLTPMVEHFSHHHPLTRFRIKQGINYLTVCCKVCEEKISGEVYGCFQCSFLLHRKCAEDLRQEIQHFLHPQHPLFFQSHDKLGNSPRGYHSCSSCLNIRWNPGDVVFCCREENCEFVLQPRCALQTMAAVETGVPSTLAHFQLGTLSLRFNKQEICLLCGQTIWGVGYHSPEFKFNFAWSHLHKACVELPQELNHPFHPQHSLMFKTNSLNKRLSCHVCNGYASYYLYCCVECEFYLDMRCAVLTPRLKHPQHEHCLAYFEENYKHQDTPLHCKSCGKRCKRDFYRCVPCNFGLHKDCLPLPANIEHSCHLHPLTLLDKFIDVFLDDQYCDECEKIRHPDHGVYRCEMCNFSAHIDCVIPEFTNKGEYSVKDGITSLTDRPNQANTEIAGLEEKIEVMKLKLVPIERNLEQYLDRVKELELAKEKALLVHHRGDELTTRGPEVINHLQCDMKKLSNLQHPCHDHALVRRELSEHCLLDCVLCKERLSGIGYCCFDCEFFLDEACFSMDFPSQLQQHPSHPNHSLVLKSGHYCCYDSDCDFKIDALMATATLSPHLNEDDGAGGPFDMIKHLSHEHHLMSFDIREKHKIKCSLCGRSGISGQVYGCPVCLYFLDIECARAPQEVHEHPLHHCQQPLSIQVIDPSSKRRQCHACQLWISSWIAYRCNDCQFELDIDCAIRILPPGEFEQRKQDCVGTVENFPHQHQLSHFRKKDKIRCAVCADKISSDDYYGCFTCTFFLHRTCAEEIPRKIQHYLHPQHPLSLSESDTKCYSCSLYTIDGISFSCQSCSFYLHPRCALESLSVVETEGAATSLSHFIHDHPLTLHFSAYAYGVSRFCQICQSLVEGLSYGCSTCEDFFIHKSCAGVSQRLESKLHPRHPLVLLPKAPAGYFYCNSCRERSTESAYCCIDCEFYLDVKCASLKLTVKDPRHEHPLAYFEKFESDKLRCSLCGEGCRRDILCCRLCNFCLHHDCLPLPPTIQHDFHPYHPLVLHDKFVDELYEDQYCDYCEKIRNPDHGAYCCEECKISAHIECIIPISNVEFEEGATENLELDEAVESGESMIDNPELENLNMEMAHLWSQIEILRRNKESLVADLDELKTKR